MPKYLVKIDDREFEIELEKKAGGFDVLVNGEKRNVSSYQLGESRSVMLVDGQASEIDVRGNGYDSTNIVFLKGREIKAEIEDFNLAQLRKTAGMSSGVKVEKVIKSPMPGLVLESKVQIGDQVQKGQPLLVVEAMKMENIIKAQSAGVVKDLFVKAGDSVEKDDKLLELE